MGEVILKEFIPRLQVGEFFTVRDSVIDGHLSVTRLTDGINIVETLDGVEECIYVSMKELTLIQKLAR